MAKFNQKGDSFTPVTGQRSAGDLGQGSGFPAGSWTPPSKGKGPTGAKGAGHEEGQYSTGTDSIGSETAPLAHPGNEVTAPYGGAPPDAGDAVAHGNIQYPEGQGSRLTFSPSMKLVDPTGFSVPTQANGRIVPSGPPGRSRAEFNQGLQNDTTGVFGPSGGGGPNALIEQHPVGEAVGGGDEQRVR